MKYIKICSLLIALISVFGISNLSAQSKIQKAEFQVHGVCDMCKKRIENAALIKGVKSANWDKANQTIEVIFSSKKTAVEDIQKAIAEAGHDTKGVKATEKSYDELPACCRYRDGEVHVH